MPKSDNSFTKTGIDKNYQTLHLVGPAYKAIADSNGITREALAQALNLDFPHTNAVLMALEIDGKIYRRNKLWRIR